MMNVAEEIHNAAADVVNKMNGVEELINNNINLEHLVLHSREDFTEMDDVLSEVYTKTLECQEAVLRKIQELLAKETVRVAAENAKLTEQIAAHEKELSEEHKKGQ